MLTIEEVAERANIDEKHLGKIERGKSGTTMKTFAKLALVLNIPCTISNESIIKQERPVK